MLTERIKERQAERDKLAEQLAIEENNRPVFTEPQVMAFLNYIKNLPHDDMLKRRTIINIFVSAIYLYDDHYTLIFNAGGKKIKLDNLPLDDIESAIDGECSSMVADAPPRKIDKFRQKLVDFSMKSP